MDVSRAFTPLRCWLEGLVSVAEAEAVAVETTGALVGGFAGGLVGVLADLVNSIVVVTTAAAGVVAVDVVVGKTVGVSMVVLLLVVRFAAAAATATAEFVSDSNCVGNLAAKLLLLFESTPLLLLNLESLSLSLSVAKEADELVSLF